MVKKIHSMAITCKSMIEIMRFFIVVVALYHRASPSTSLQCNGAALQGESVHKTQTSDHFDPLPNGDGVARVNGVVLSIGEQLLSERHWLRGAYDQPDCVDCSDRARSKGSQFVVGLCTVPCNERYHTYVT